MLTIKSGKGNEWQIYTIQSYFSNILVTFPLNKCQCPVFHGMTLAKLTTSTSLNPNVGFDVGFK